MDETIREELRPLAPYQALYASAPRRFAIPEAGKPEEWDAWRAAFRARLAERLGGFPAQHPPVRYTAAPPTEHDGYTRTYIEYESAPGEVVPAWLLVPHSLSEPAPAAIAVHGHGHGVDGLVGIGPAGAELTGEADYQQSFAVELCRRGMVVIAPELRGFGRRREAADQAISPDTSSCETTAWWGIMLGKPLLGSRVWDTVRALDLLQSLPAVDPQRIGIMGISGGGTVTMFTAALEPRLRATAICSYFCTFRDSILSIRHCHCNYVPGLLQDGEMYDIAALIAPRPLLIVSGNEDPIFPLAGVLESYERVRGAYAALGAADRIEKHIFEGGHQINGARAYDFLQSRLSST